MAPLARRFFAGMVNILYYHAVWPKDSAHLTTFGGVTLDAFARDMRLVRRFFQPVALEHILQSHSASRQVTSAGRPLLAVTFDDGCDLTRSGATDVLDELGISATTFVVLDCVGNQQLMWQHMFLAIRTLKGDDVYLREFNRLAEKVAPGSSISSAEEQLEVTRKWPMSRKQEFAQEVWKASDMPATDEYLERLRPYADWNDLDDWRRRGHAIGLHTRSHPFCSVLSDSEVDDEVTVPAMVLCRRFGLSSIPFAYPFGDRLPAQRAAIVSEQAALACMLGVDGLSNDVVPRYQLGRVRAETGLTRSLFASPLIRAWRRQVRIHEQNFL